MRDDATDAPARQPKLKPANENPWYVLMTLFGEQEGEEIDWELHKKNREVWNAWAVRGAPQNWNHNEFSQEVAKVLEVPNSECEQNRWSELVNAHTKGEERVQDAFERVYRERNGSDAQVPALPNAADKANFSGIEFNKAICAKQMVFPRGADFSDVSFGKNIIFERTLFAAQSYFVGVEFLENVTFENSTHWSEMNFLGATFVEETNFRGCNFKKTTTFSRAHFYSRADFSSVVFEGIASYTAAQFGARSNGERVSFRDCLFQRPTSFRNCAFVSCYPDLSGAELHEKTAFSAQARFWPQEIHHTVELARDTCATIRHNLAKQGLPEDEHFFFRREMHFTEKMGSGLFSISSNASIWQRLPYLLFGMFSDYGHSIARPTLWLAGLWAFGFVAFWGYLAGCCVPAPTGVIENPMGSAMALSFSNLFPLFGFGRTFLKEELEALPAVLQLLSGVQTVFSLPLLFFLGLGLRQRFRLR